MRDHFRKLRGRTVSMRDVVTEAREGIESSSDIERDELLTAFLTTCYPARVSQDA